MTEEAPGGSILGGHWPHGTPHAGGHTMSSAVSGGEKSFPEILKLLN